MPAFPPIATGERTSRDPSNVPKSEELNMSTCFPLCPQLGHCPIQSALRICANSGSARACEGVERNDPITEMVAKKNVEKNVESGRAELRDPEQISARAFKELGCVGDLRLSKAFPSP